MKKPESIKRFIKNCYLLIIPILITCQNEKKTVNYDPGITDNYSDITDVDNYKLWGPYNIHDPSCIKAGNYYYLYTTDAYYFPRIGNREEQKEDWRKRKEKMDSIGFGNIPIRRSKDLVKWEFIGWVFDSIPNEAVKHIEETSGGDHPRNIWAPFIFKWKNQYRLYFAVSLFGKKTSYIGLAVSNSPDGPYKLAGAVVLTTKNDKMNAIDPSVIADHETGKHWMHYGSYFGGLYCIELNPKTGLALNKGDKGHLVARRAEYKTKNLEAPEIIYNPNQKQYFLFTSYDALFTHYNVRVGRSERPEGPFFDYFGKNLADTVNDYPILTYAYRFDTHPGWAGVGHCGVINDDGNYFMFHQGRLAPDNLMMVLHVRKIFWNSDGWPIVSPQRYAAVPEKKFKSKDIEGQWEIISLNEVADSVKLWQGQIPSGGWHYDTTMFNNPVIIQMKAKGTITQWPDAKWLFSDNKILLENKKDVTELIVSAAWDWENKKQTIVFTGIQPNGIGLWGKKK